MRSRLAFMGGLLLGAVLGTRSAAGQTAPASEAPPLLQVVPQDERAFAAWYTPDRGPVRLSWRTATGGVWRDSTLLGDRALIGDLRNGIAYDVRVTAAGGQGLSSQQRVTPRPRTDCKAVVWVVCDARDARSYLSEVFVTDPDDPPPLLCGTVELLRLSDDAPGCLYRTFRGPMLLNRAIGSSYVRTSPLPDAEAVRAAVEAGIWEGLDSPLDRKGRLPVAPLELADAIVGRVADSTFSRASSFALEVQPRILSRITRFTPVEPVAGRVAIYHEGHGGAGVEIGAPTIEWLLLRGWTVYALDMPLIGLNASDRSYDLVEHIDFARIEEAPYRGALDAFLLPVKWVVDEIEEQHTEDTDSLTILLIGRSGGGWTASAYGLLDPRISVAVSVAGAVPMSMVADTTLAAFSDYEQLTVLSDAVPSDARLLYAGTRGTMFFYSLNDPCCFRVPPDHPWVQAIRDAGGELGKVTDVFVDDIAEHGLGPRGYDRLDVFLDRLGVGSRPFRRGALAPGR